MEPKRIQTRKAGDAREVAAAPSANAAPRRIPSNPQPKPPLGDVIESFLASHGITKEWWVAFKEKHGLPPLCNCDERHAWFNKLSGELPFLAGIAAKLLEFLTRRPAPPTE